MNPQRNPDEPSEDELLLPWRATGRLAATEAARLDARLAADLALARRLALVEEEREAAVGVNAAIAEPSEHVRTALFARIGAIEARRAAPRPVPARRAGLVERWGALVAGLSPRAVGFAAAAAALVIVVEAGIIVAGPREARYETASGPGAAPAEGAFVLAAFAPEATAAQVLALLAERGATIVDGPRPGGLFRLRVAPRHLAPAELDAAVAALRGRTDVIRLVLPGAP